jgi:sorbitol/mannitol transport system substrate-binding protein
VAASSIEAASQSVFNDTGYAYAPVDKTKYSGWLYTWSLGIPKNSKNQSAAWAFLDWATSKKYISTVGAKLGWSQLPPGSRTSTYAHPQYAAAAKAYAGITLNSIANADPNHPTVNPVPYTGVQFVDIPQFENFGTLVSQQISGAIAGTESVSAALSAGQQDAAASGAGQS